MTDAVKKRPRRWRRRLLWSALATALALGGGYLGRNRFLAPGLLRLAEGPLAEQLGARVEVGHFGGSWFGNLVLEGVRFEADRGPLRSLRARRVEVSYSPVQLVRGAGLDGIFTVVGDVDEVRLVLDASASPPDEPTPATSGPLVLPASLPRLEFTLGELALESDGTRVELRDLAVTGGGPDGAPVALELAHLALFDDTGELFRSPVSARLAPDPTRLRVERLGLGSWLALENLHFTPEPDGALGLTTDLHLGEGSGTLGARLDDGALRGRFELSDLELGGLREGLGALVPEDLSGRVSVATTFDVDLEHPEEGTLDLRLDLATARLLGFDVDRFELAGGLAEGKLGVTTANLAAGENRLSVEGLEAPLAGTLEELLRGLSGTLRLEGRDLAPYVPQESPVPLPEHLVRLDVRLAANERAEVSGTVETVGGHLEVRRGIVIPPLRGAPWTETTLDLELDVDFEDLGPAGELLGLVWAGSLDGDLRLEGSLAAPLGTLRLEARALDFDGLRFERGRVEARGEGTQVTIDTLELFGEGLSILAAGVLRPEAAVWERLTVQAEVASGAPFLPAELALEGVRLEATLDGPLLAPEGVLGLHADRVGFGEESLRDLAAEATHADGVLDVSRLALEFRGRQLESALRVGTAPGPRTLEITRLVIQDETRRLALAAPATLRIDDEGLACEELRFEGTGTLEASFAQTAASTTATLSLAAFDPGLLVDPFVPPGTSFPQVAGSATVALLGDDLRAELDLASPGSHLSASGPPWDLALRGVLAEKRAEGLVIEGRTPGTERIVARYDGPLDPLAPMLLPPDAATRLHVEAAGVELAAWGALFAPAAALTQGTAHALVDLGGTPRALRGRVSLGLVDVDSVHLALGQDGEPISAELVVDVGESLRVERARIHSGERVTLGLQGSLARSLDLVALLEDPTAFESAPLEVAGELNLPDLQWLAPRVPALRRLGGALSGSLTVAGTLGAPEVSGLLRLSGGELRLASELPPCRAVAAEVAFEGDQIELRALTGELGAAPFSAEGKLDLSGPLPRADFRVRGEELLLVRNENARIRAGVDVRVQGVPERLQISGDVVLTEGRISQDLNFLSGLFAESAPSSGARGLSFSISREPPLAAAVFDLRVRSSGPLRIKNNLIDARLRPELALRGTGEVPLLQGRVYVDPSKLSLPSGSLNLDTGLVEFREDDPFVPKIALQGSMRVKGYDVTAQIEGPFDAPEVLLSSTPPLPNDELLVFFLTGNLPSGTSAERSRAAVETVAVYLARDVLTRWLFPSSAESGESLFDRLELDLGADVSRSGAPTLRATYYLTAGQRLKSRAPYILAERDEFDRVNYGIGILFRFR